MHIELRDGNLWRSAASHALLFSLLTFSVGLIARPIGALVFGKIGDSTGRKGAFLITITIMGVATFGIGLLPTYDDIGVWAPILLVTMRVLQGFALGGEYGGAAIYVAEHAAPNRRGSATGWIQSTASIGLIGALGVVLITRALMGEEAFREWGWRIPFLVSIGLLGVSVWIRLQLEESPAFKKLQDEGKVTKKAYVESFFRWPNLRIVLIALFGVMMAQGVVWYTAHFYSQFFLERILKIDSQTVNVLLIAVVLLGGVGTLQGAMLGAVAFLVTEEILAGLTEHWKAIFGPLITLIALYARGGLMRIVRLGAQP